MRVDKGDHGLNRRSSAARARQAEVLRRVRPCAEPAPAKAGDLARLPQLAVLARERLDALTRVRRCTGPHALVTPGLPHPVTQRLARAAACSPWWSGTIQTARARISGECASSWLHPLKSWSLRKTRRGSESINGRFDSVRDEDPEAVEAILGIRCALYHERRAALAAEIQAQEAAVAEQWQVEGIDELYVQADEYGDRSDEVLAKAAAFRPVAIRGVVEMLNKSDEYDHGEMFDNAIAALEDIAEWA
jgi:hypothetical protein